MTDSDRNQAAIVQIKLRCRESLRAEIEKQAQQNGWSINTEINRRLERSLHDLDMLSTYFGQPETLELLKPIAGIINRMMLLNKKSWKNDKPTRDDISRQIVGLLADADDEEGFAASRAAYEVRADFERRAAEREGIILPEGYCPPNLPSAASGTAPVAMPTATGSSDLEMTIKRAVIAALRETLPQSLTNRPPPSSGGPPNLTPETEG